jgi:2-polyprenyl-6-methoxyphenol hydroxylase-like FAD-dependent oxidoreductase
MAENGCRVLVIEREREFKDRVRGEFMTPWGGAELKALGIYELIRDSCGIEAPFTNLGFGPRDLSTTTPQRLPALGFYHPAMQEQVLGAAKAAGTELRRGATVISITPGATPTVTFQDGNGMHQVSARLVVAADGRTSGARKWGGFEVKENLYPFSFAGVLLEGVSSPVGHSFLIFVPPLGACTAMVPSGRGRVRTYVAYHDNSGLRLHGEENIPRFVTQAKKAELLVPYFENARSAGPLASFRCGDFWVDHPYKNGVALVGDAASTTDPVFGQGLATTVRDVRVLRDCLIQNDDWDVAGHAYAAEHDAYSAIVRKVSQWFRTIFLEQGDDADARRGRALALIAEDETRVPDHLFSGPELPADDGVRQRFFGEV